MTVMRGKANNWTSFQQLDGEAEEIPHSEEKNQNVSVSEPPVCHVDCNLSLEHCDICQKCFELCKEHSGCECDPLSFDQFEQFDCVIRTGDVVIK